MISFKESDTKTMKYSPLGHIDHREAARKKPWEERLSLEVQDEALLFQG
jgi:hypothetical protein